MTHTDRKPSIARRAGLIAIAALLMSLLAACAGLPFGQTATELPAAESTPALADAPTSAPVITTAPPAAPTEAPAPTSAPAAPAPTSAPNDTAAPGGGATAAPDNAAANAIKQVIQKANQEQQQAVAAHDPGPMRDTATADYYTQAAQGLNDLFSAGVTAIELVKLDWGPIAMQDKSTAQATTVETWRTNFSDGSTTQEADTNVYTMVLEGNAWKVQDDQHPDSQRLQPPQGTPGTQPGTQPTPQAPIDPSQADQSRNWAGYAAQNGTFTAVSGSWIVPNVSAGRTSAADATWVGIGGVSAHDLIQAGTDATVQGGRVVYTAWIEMLPQAAQRVQLDVSAGDAVNVSIAQQADQKWQIRIRNTTTGQSYEKTVSYQSSQSSAEWIEESPAVGRRALLPLDNFGSIKFSEAAATENGKQVTITEAGGQPITMTSRTGQPLAQPSALGSDGASFSVMRTNAGATPIVPGSGDVPGQELSS